MMQPALDLVVAALEKIRETSEHAPRASRRALAQLQFIAPGKRELLASVRERGRGCTECVHLARSRTETVLCVRRPNCEIMFIGEARGAAEDKQGAPFVRSRGQLLTTLLH